MRKLGILVDMNKISNSDYVYNVVIASVHEKAQKQYDWAYEKKQMHKNDIIASIKNGAVWLNVELDGNDIKGKSGALSRFTDSKNKPVVIISQITDGERILGYKCAQSNGDVRNVMLKEVLAYAERVTQSGGIPIQNAIFVPTESDKRAHIKSYPNCPFIEEVVIIQKNKNTNVQKVDTQANNKTLTREDIYQIYTKEQLMEIKKGKEHGVDIKVFGNPALSAEQMRVLREGLEKKLNVKPLAFPEFSVELMEYYIDELMDGSDIKQYLNPAYTVEQLAQVSLGYISGIDLNKISDPKMSAEQMAEIRERLESGMWDKTFSVSGS